MKRFPGVTNLGGGWFRIRTEIIHPKTGRAHEIDRKIEATDAAAAANRLATERAEWIRKRSRVGDVKARRRLGEAMRAWHKEKEPTVKPSTASTYKSAVEWWDKVLGAYWLDALEPRDVREALGGSICSADTVDGRLRVLRTFAREEKCSHIIEGVSVKRSVREDERIEDEGRGLSLEELRAFLAAGPSASKASWWPRAWALVASMAWTGLRFGEASALEWRDVDLDACTIRVRRAQWRGKVGHVKARCSKRTVVIPTELAELLRAHRINVPSFTLLFPSRRRHATYVSNTHARKSIVRVLGKAKIALDGRPTIHCLRHTANNLVRQHASELVRQALIGHADEEIGARYSHVGIEEKRAAVLSVVRAVKGAEL